MDGLRNSGPPPLPVPLTRFFGRRSETADVRELLRQTRLVTLVGAPGCGKTRLSVELCTELSPGPRDGIWFVELAPVSGPDQVADAVRVAAGIPEAPGRPAEETVLEALLDAEILLVLDNCEHVAEGAAELARRLVAGCPAVRILATSRAPLGLTGEQVWMVPPLAISASVELFADRAGLVSRGSGVDGEGGEALVEEICRRLDGLPLAIELIAAWTRVLSLREIVERLDRARSLLQSSARDTVERQATMEATVDWSYRLLSSDQQRLFDHLSVFAGGFDLAAARAVSGLDEAAVLAGLTALVDHSLLVTEPASEESMRYRLLEPVRQCAEVGLLARGEEEPVRRAHAEHYLAVARAWDATLRGGRRARAFQHLDPEDGNFMAALVWARTQDVDLGLRLCSALALFWELRGRVNEGRIWLDALLEVGTADRQLRATATARAGRMAHSQRDYGRARALWEESLAIKRELDDAVGVARRQRGLAMVALVEGDTRTAARLCEESIETFRAQGEEQGLVWSLIALGWTQYTAGDLDSGYEHMRQALDVARPAGNVAAAASALLALAYGAQIAGDPVAQRAHFVGSVAALREAGGPLGQPGWLMAGAALAVTEGRTRAALRLAGAAESLSRRSGNYVHEVEQAMHPLWPLLDRARQEVGTAMADRVMAEGARMTVDALLAEATAEPGDDQGELLSTREREVLELVAQGRTNVAIARELFLSKRTVESHLDHIKQKLGLTTRQQVMAWALGESAEPATP